jgi:hypothetical protein
MAGPDPAALYGALATVAAVTAALQTSAVFAVLPDADRLESRAARVTPDTQQYTDLHDDAKSYRVRVGIVAFPLAVINLAVIVAWGDVVLCRITSDWVFVTPWAAVAVAWIVLVSMPLWLISRASKVLET